MYTKGKWCVLKDRNRIWTDMTVGVDGLEYEPHPIIKRGKFKDDPKELQANAKLMASSPDLLEICKLLVDYIESNYDQDEEAMEQCNIALKVIYKAEGRL